MESYLRVLSDISWAAPVSMIKTRRKTIALGTAEDGEGWFEYQEVQKEKLTKRYKYLPLQDEPAHVAWKSKLGGGGNCL